MITMTTDWRRDLLTETIRNEVGGARDVAMEGVLVLLTRSAWLAWAQCRGPFIVA